MGAVEPLIKASNINKTFYKNSKELKILKNINLQIFKKEKVVIIGKSGAGKTTLLHILGTLDLPNSGEIIFDKIDVTNLKEDNLSKFRGKMIGFVFQFHYLINEFSALENVIIPAIINNFNNKEIIDRGEYLLEKLNIINRKNHKPSELSGGEQQRVAIARALINNPKILMADEPTGNLDTQTSNETFDLLEKIQEETKMAMLIVTHNPELVKRFDRKIELKDGEIIN